MPTETITGDRNKKMAHVCRFWLAATHVASSVPAESSNQQPWCKRHGLQWLMCHGRDEPHCPAVLTWCCVRLCFRPLSLELPSNSECCHSISVQCQKTALILLFIYHNVSKTFQCKKELEVIRLFYKSLIYFFPLTHMTSTQPTVF